MRWIVRLGQEAESAVAWLKDQINTFDTARLDSIRIDRGRSRYEGVYGHCLYPTKARSTFRMSCHLPGPFPCTIVTRKPPLYPRSDGTFARAPRGCRRSVLCYDPQSGRQWYRLLGKTRLHEINQAAVWIVSHEAFHFLRHTRQVKGRNNEIEADRFADDMMQCFCSQETLSLPAAKRQLTLPWAG